MWYNKNRIKKKIWRGKDYPFVGLKWEITPCLPQEPHYFNSGSSQEIVGRCPICDGSGIIYEEVKTPTGKKIPQEDSIIKLGKGYFKWHFFRTIIKTCKMLDIKQIRLVRTHETNINILELSKDIHIGLMPMYVDDEDGAKIKKRAISVKGIKV